MVTPVPPSLYPFESHYETVKGFRYHYIEEGEGEPVVMVHGNPSWSFYYRELMQRLSPHFHCIAVDHIGMGLSDKPTDEEYPYTLERRIDDLEAFLEQKGIVENIHLVMHDWGGMIGMGYAHRHPDRIKKIVVLNTAAFHLPKSKSFPLALWFTRTFLGAFLVRGFNAFSGMATREGVKRIKMPKEVRKGYTAPYNNWHNRIGTLRFVQDIPLKPGDPGYDVVAEVAKNLDQFAETPALIAWGLKDMVFDVHFLEEWEKHWPHAQVHRYEDGGHYILEDYQEEIGQLVEAFFTGTKS